MERAFAEKEARKADKEMHQEDLKALEMGGEGAVLATFMRDEVLHSLVDVPKTDERIVELRPASMLGAHATHGGLLRFNIKRGLYPIRKRRQQQQQQQQQQQHLHQQWKPHQQVSSGSSSGRIFSILFKRRQWRASSNRAQDNPCMLWTRLPQIRTRW